MSASQSSILMSDRVKCHTRAQVRTKVSLVDSADRRKMWRKLSVAGQHAHALLSLKCGLT